MKHATPAANTGPLSFPATVVSTSAATKSAIISTRSRPAVTARG